MSKFLIWVKSAIIVVLGIIVVLWLSYFLDSLNRSQHHFFLENNNALNFLRWINKVSNGALVLPVRLFDDNFYLENFPLVSVFAETLFVILLMVAAARQKHKRKEYVLKLCISILCFVVLFEFLEATLKLFVPA